MNLILTALLALFAFSDLNLSPAWGSPLPPTGLPDLVEKVLPGVVNISSTTVTRMGAYGMDEFMRYFGVPQEYTQSSLGTGFLFDANEGLVLTNHHVVDHASEVMVTLIDKREFKARIIGKDAKLDLAILQIRDKDRKVPGKLQALPLGNSDPVRIAETVFAVGNPMGLSHTVTMGIISAKNRTIGIGPFDNFLQTDASINPGNSGGPLFNLKGEVIGINTAIFSKVGQSGGLGFAIPSNEAKKVIPDLQKYGRVPRPWLGLLGQSLNPALVAHYDLPVSKGVLIYNMVRSGPADEAGLKQGDIITHMDDKAVSDPQELEKALFAHRPKEKTTLKVRRGGRKLDLKLDLEELPPRIDNLPQGII
jgi:serine protease Do